MFKGRGMSVELPASPFSSGIYGDNRTPSSGLYFQNFNLTNIQALKEKNKKELTKFTENNDNQNDFDEDDLLDEEDW